MAVAQRIPKEAQLSQVLPFLSLIFDLSLLKAFVKAETREKATEGKASCANNDDGDA
jgi:hypothetical protein